MKIVVLALLLLASVDGFAAPAARTVAKQSGSKATLAPRLHAPVPASLHLRGGTTAIQSSLAGVLTGATGIPAVAGIAAAAGTLAYIRQAYIFSLSYGLSMLGIGGAVLLASPGPLLLQVHAGLVAAYGGRLFAFLLWRQRFQPGYDGEARLRALDKTPRLKRTPIILSTALFYALMSSPLVYHFQSSPLSGVGAVVSTVGCVVAAVGLIYEAVADQQKSLFKMALRADSKEDAQCTSGVYAQSRHANYFGELVFWSGATLAGVPAVLAASVPLWVRAIRAVCSGLGLAGIYFIMLSATKRLEARQEEKYKSSAGFDDYMKNSNALFPKLW